MPPRCDCRRISILKTALLGRYSVGSIAISAPTQAFLRHNAMTLTTLLAMRKRRSKSPHDGPRFRR